MRSSKWTRRRTTSPLGGSSTAGNRAPRRWGASSAVTFLRRPGTTGSITASKSFSSPTTTIGLGLLFGAPVLLLPFKMKRGWVTLRAEEVEEGPFGVHYPAPVKYLAPL